MQLLCSLLSSAVGSRTILVPCTLHAWVSIPGVHREMISRELPDVLVQSSVKRNMLLCEREGVYESLKGRQKTQKGRVCGRQGKTDE